MNIFLKKYLSETRVGFDFVTILNGFLNFSNLNYELGDWGFRLGLGFGLGLGFRLSFFRLELRLGLLTWTLELDFGIGLWNWTLELDFGLGLGLGL